MAIAHGARLPVVPLGGNTGLVGRADVTAAEEIVLSTHRLDRIRGRRSGETQAERRGRA